MAEQWYRSIPPITRAYATACVVTTLAAHLDVIGPLTLYLNVYSIYYQWEVCRERAAPPPRLSVADTPTPAVVEAAY